MGADVNGLRDRRDGLYNVHIIWRPRHLRVIGRGSN